MGFTGLKKKHYENPKFLVNEFMEDLDLKDKVIRQKQEVIEDLEKHVAEILKKISGLEERLKERKWRLQNFRHQTLILTVKGFTKP